MELTVSNISLLTKIVKFSIPILATEINDVHLPAMDGPRLPIELLPPGPCVNGFSQRWAMGSPGKAVRLTPSVSSPLAIPSKPASPHRGARPGQAGKV